MNRRLPSARALMLALGFLWVGLAPGFGQSPESSGTYPLLHYGRALLVDAKRLELRLAGTFSPVGPGIALDAQGRIWGRLEPSHLAALDPVRQQIVVRLKLADKPGVILVTSSGEAYVTHRKPAQDGFRVSVVDTRRDVLLRELRGLAGLPLELVEAGGAVYAAAAGVLREDPLEWHLYRLEPGTDRYREVLASADAGYSWTLAAAGALLYVGYLPAGKDSRPGRVEVRDARDAGTAQLLASWENTGGRLRGVFAVPETPDGAGRAGKPAQVLLFREAADGNTELLVLDPLLQGSPRVRLLSGPFARALGVHGSTLVYVDRAFQTGQTRVALVFYDLEAGRELKRIDVRDFIVGESGT